MVFNTYWTLKIFATQTTAKSFKIRVNQQMTFQFVCCTETILTFIANIWFHTFMSLYVYLKVIVVAEFLLANVIREPISFIA